MRMPFDTDLRELTGNEFDYKEFTDLGINSYADRIVDSILGLKY